MKVREAGVPGEVKVLNECVWELGEVRDNRS